MEREGGGRGRDKIRMEMSLDLLNRIRRSTMRCAHATDVHRPYNVLHRIRCCPGSAPGTWCCVHRALRCSARITHCRISLPNGRHVPMLPTKPCSFARLFDTRGQINHDIYESIFSSNAKKRRRQTKSRARSKKRNLCSALCAPKLARRAVISSSSFPFACTQLSRWKRLSEKIHA